jgi:anti-sigma factor RsiW
MCDYSTKLTTWLDRELEPEEMARVQQHLQDCDECRARLVKYEQVSKAFDHYCQGTMAATVSDRRGRHSVPILSAAAAILFLAVTAALLLRTRVQPLPATSIAIVRPPESPHTSEPRPAPGNTAHPRRMPAPVRRQTATWLPPQPAIEVAIPADSMFPPGAIPEGVNFIADVNFAPDGSARQMRLRPRLTVIERSASQP